MTDKLLYKLEIFEGPLDMLLHLISKNKLNIYDIKISVLVDQYISQIEMMKDNDMDVASEFLEMAARLVYMKTVSLLPKHEESERLRAELTGALLDYAECKEMAEKLSLLTGGFRTLVREPAKIEFDKSYKLIHKPGILLEAYYLAAGRGERKLPPPKTAFSGIVSKKIISVSSKIVFLLRNIWHGKTVAFKSLFDKKSTKSDVVATFLATLELARANRIKITEKKNELHITVNKER